MSIWVATRPPPWSPSPVALLHPFHLAFPVVDLPATRAFYEGLLGCRVGRTSASWIDFDMFGHQITAHLVERGEQTPTNPVDGDDVPVRHFGVILPWDDWERLAERLRAADLPFLIAPHVRFEGQVGEQGTFFVQDPCANALEFKSFRDATRLFATRSGSLHDAPDE